MSIRLFKLCSMTLLCATISTVFITTLEARVNKPKATSYQPKYSAIVIDARTGKVLHEEEADGIRHPASLTKMMTLYMLFEAVKTGKLKMDSTISVSEKASRQSPSKLGLQPGQTITVRTAMLGLITKSANDVAVAVGEHLGGSEEAFARKMTLKAQALGMSNTLFKNASGLPNPQQITTARDMATLSQALYRDFPKEYKYFSTQSFSHKGTVHRTHNHLLGKVHGVDGIKTGWIVASGFNLAASAIRYDDQNKPHRLITVVLGGPNRHWRDRRVEELLETHFAERGLKKGNKNTGSKGNPDQDIVVESVEELNQEPLNELIYEINDDEAHKETDGGHLDSVVMESLNESIELPLKNTNDAMPANWVIPKAGNAAEQSPPNRTLKNSKKTQTKIKKKAKVKRI